MRSFFVRRKGEEMGGRGSSFGRGGGRGSGSIDSRISSIDKQIEGLGVKMASLFRSATADHGGFNLSERKQYNKMLEKTRSLKSRKSDLQVKKARAAQQPSGKRTFVNSYGEATRRYITSSISEGKNIQAHDLTMLYHGLEEEKLWVRVLKLSMKWRIIKPRRSSITRKSCKSI